MSNGRFWLITTVAAVAYVVILGVMASAPR